MQQGGHRPPFYLYREIFNQSFYNSGEMKKKYTRHVKKIDAFHHGWLKLLTRFVNLFTWRYKVRSKYKIKKGETVVVLSNHQTDIDSEFIELSFNRPLYALATDSIFSSHIGSWFFGRLLGHIPKRKGMADIASVLQMKRVISEGGSLVMFPEGNRTYAEFQYYLAEGFARFIKSLKSTLILFNLEGGTGRNPRWRHKQRKGVFQGKIRRVLPYEEYADMDDKELEKIILDGIRVYDSESGRLYKSNKKAEYLERMLFVCPKCGKMHTLYSKGDLLTCQNCGLEVMFNEDMSLSSKDETFSFRKLNDWYQYQKKFVREMEIDDNEPIFIDEQVKFFHIVPFKYKKKICVGKLSLDRINLKIGQKTIPIRDIVGVSPISGIKLQISTKTESYLLKGKERFNPLKYALMLNKLDSGVKLGSTDRYYNLED